MLNIKRKIVLHQLIAITVCHLHFGAGLQDEDFKLECLPTGIHVTFSDGFFVRNDIDVNSKRQLHFRNSAGCIADRTDGGFSLAIYAPFDGCNTKVKHEEGQYVYTNEVVFSSLQSTNQSNFVSVMQLRCSYDDTYVASSDYGITPYIRTLYFDTTKGNLSVSMNLYQRADYHPKSRLGFRPVVAVSSPVYVSVDMDNIFGDDRIVTTVEECYASDSPSFKVMDDMYHFLIQGRCASPDDGTVVISTNGAGDKSRFKFNMFRWRERNIEYIYLHCQVRICNTTAQACTGDGPLCDGVRLRAVDAGRKRRATSEDGGIATIGPIAAATEMTRVGEPQAETTLQQRIKTGKEFLALYIYVVIAIVVLVAVVVIISLIVVRRRQQMFRRQKKSPTSSDGGDWSPPSIHKPYCLPQ